MSSEVIENGNIVFKILTSGSKPDNNSGIESDNDIKITSSSIKSLLISKFFKTIIENIDPYEDSKELSDNTNEIEIPVTNIEPYIIKKIIKYCEYYMNNPMKKIVKPLINEDLSTVVDEWYINYINDFSNDNLFKLIAGVNFLDIPPLLDLSCAKVASMLKGKTPDQIINNFNIDMDESESGSDSEEELENEEEEEEEEEEEDDDEEDDEEDESEEESEDE